MGIVLLQTYVQEDLSLSVFIYLSVLPLTHPCMFYSCWGSAFSWTLEAAFARPQA